MRSLLHLSVLLGTAMAAGCPYMSGELRPRGEQPVKRQQTDSIKGTTITTEEFLAPFELNDTNVYMTTDSGTPIDEAVSLKAGQRGPTLLEDFIFRQKLQRFDHERVSAHIPYIENCSPRVLISMIRSRSVQYMLEGVVS
jgi:catalase